MKHAFARHVNSLVAADERAAKAIKRLEPGEIVLLSLVRVRSGRWHRLFMGGCAAIAENSDEPLTTDAVKQTLKLLAGHVDVVQDKHGNVFKVPKSIAYESLTAEEWESMWPSIEKSAAEHFGFSFELMQQGLSGFYD
jgi:hypothetical protein